MTAYVFTGPTLPPEEARQVLDAVYLPPVSQGDLYLVARMQPQAVGIIDGFFERVPAVWHKEILWAMARGIHVFGSASMGALRAAELESFGMEGVGAVYEAFRHGRLEDDDEVAVAHGPASVGYRGSSEAMVNIRFTLQRAESQGVISPGTCAALVDIAKSLFYPDRSYARVIEMAVDQGLPGPELKALHGWLPTGRIDQKREDALAMLGVIRERLRQGLPPKRVSYSMENTRVWNLATSVAGDLAEDGDGLSTVLPTTMLEEIRLEGSFPQVLREALIRRLSIQVAEHKKLDVTGEMMQETGNRWRDRHGLADLATFQRWLEERNLSIEEFSRMMRDEALRLLVERSMLLETRLRLTDELHLSGEYDRVLAKAHDKQRVLEARGLQNPSLDHVGKSWDELVRWYFEDRLGRPVPEDIEEYSRNNGFEHQLDFRRAVLRDYCYAALDD